MHRLHPATEDLSRRAFLSASLAAAATLALSACGPRGFVEMKPAASGVAAGSATTPRGSSNGATGGGQASASGEPAGGTSDGASTDPNAAARTSALATLSWVELSALADDIAAAPDAASALAAASSRGLTDADGALDIEQERVIDLADGSVARIRLAGLRADDRADGRGRAGITLAFSTPIAMRGMNGLDSARGGWQASDLRAWLADDGLALLPRELAGVIRPVTKRTVSRTGGKASASSDALWLFSESELGGTDYLNQTFGTKSATFDEGGTYELFRRGLAGGSTLESAFVRPSAATGSWNCWWERTLDASGTGFLFRTYGGTHNTGIGYSPNFDLGICPGFCL